MEKTNRMFNYKKEKGSNMERECECECECGCGCNTQYEAAQRYSCICDQSKDSQNDVDASCIASKLIEFVIKNILNETGDNGESPDSPDSGRFDIGDTCFLIDYDCPSKGCEKKREPRYDPLLLLPVSCSLRERDYSLFCNESDTETLYLSARVIKDILNNFKLEDFE